MTHLSWYGFYYRGIFFLSGAGYHGGNEFLLLNQQYTKDVIKAMFEKYTKAELCAMLDDLLLSTKVDESDITVYEHFKVTSNDPSNKFKVHDLHVNWAQSQPSLETKRELVEKYCSEWYKEQFKLNEKACQWWVREHKFMDVFNYCKIFKIPAGMSIREFFFKNNINWMDATTVHLINLDKDVYEYFDGYWYEYDCRNSEKEEYQKGVRCSEGDDPEWMTKYFAGLTHEDQCMALKALDI